MAMQKRSSDTTKRTRHSAMGYPNEPECRMNRTMDQWHVHWSSTDNIGREFRSEIPAWQKWISGLTFTDGKVLLITPQVRQLVD
ncbi:3131_t:CDS:2 [Paraglomus brasilianum]|uniref:3131_t:CDS:1 n=1 Tax=Paraglomus brasilianum TaxID=144538 RepID=A0A9N8VTE2_9GLOM|nr:3131_t:CDS:2 [Paraglomus brasilianum]